MNEGTTAADPTPVAPLTEARDRLSEIVDQVSSTGTEFTITKYGRPAAVVVGHDDYEALIETLNILSDAETMGALSDADRDIEAGELLDLDDLD